MEKKLSIEYVKKNYHPKIWKTLKPIIEDINSIIELNYMNDFDDVYRLSNLKYQFIRSLIFSESEKYVNEKNPTIEGIGHDYYAVEYCFEKFIYNNYLKRKKEGLIRIIPKDFVIKEEAKKFAYTGIHPKIDKAARVGYKKDNAEIMRQLAILIKDKDLDFSAPAIIFIKKYYAIILFILAFLILYISGI